MKKTEIFIGQVLRWGLLLSVVVVLIGGILYLVQNGHQTIHYSSFQVEKGHSLTDIMQNTVTLTAAGIIQFGLLLLVFTQIIRVALTTWLFAQKRDIFFTSISVMILIVLIYSIFWRI